MMKTTLKKTLPRLALAALSLLSYSPGFGQTFQGTVTYAQDFVLSKAFLDMGVTKEMILSKLQTGGDWGDTIKVSYNRQGDYHSLTNSKKGLIKIYRSEANKIYTFGEGKASEKVSVQDAIDLDLSGVPDKPEIKKLDTAVTINGIKCTGLTVQWKLSKIDYFYNSSELKIDAAVFSRHSTDGWAEYLKASRALPLRIIKNVFGMSMIQTMVSAKSEEVSPDLFKIPVLVADESLNVIKMPGVEIMRIMK